MKKQIFLVVVLVVGFVSCKKETNTFDSQVTEFVDEHTAQKSLDWSGEYKGVLPDGTQMTIVLYPDETFYAKKEYSKGDDDLVFESNGAFFWDETGFIITIAGDEYFRRDYKVIENAIIYLDDNSNEIKGELSDQYRLHRISKDDKK